MEFRTPVIIGKPDFRIEPLEDMLFVGSCFADTIGKRFQQDHFHATVNPFGVMYNPASILHTVERCDCTPRIAVLTLGTNHIYRLRETGEIVDNCQKRPASLFQEEELTVDQCVDYLAQAVGILRRRRPDVRVVLTVSPIRYRKYGYHGSQLSKATLLLAADRLCNEFGQTYFPAYELMMDELRDYRFYAEDMLHPSSQAVEYIFERFAETFFSEQTQRFLREWSPIKAALGHRPFHPDSDEYRQFLADAQTKEQALIARYQTRQ
jgi:lysophospholipase L1-like esterase